MPTLCLQMFCLTMACCYVTYIGEWIASDPSHHANRSQAVLIRDFSKNISAGPKESNTFDSKCITAAFSHHFSSIFKPPCFTTTTELQDFLIISKEASNSFLDNFPDPSASLQSWDVLLETVEGWCNFNLENHLRFWQKQFLASTAQLPHPVKLRKDSDEFQGIKALIFWCWPLSLSKQSHSPENKGRDLHNLPRSQESVANLFPLLQYLREALSAPKLLRKTMHIYIYV